MYIKQMLPGNSKTYEGVAVESLPKGANAGSIRPGACNTLASEMPAEFATQTTGHDMTKISAYWEYIDVSRPLAILGALVLAGWGRIVPYGQLAGKGAVPASLDSIVAAGIGMEQLERVIDKLFRLDNTKPDTMRKHKGELRPALHAVLATMIMYFAERQREGEMLNVQAAMMTVVQAVLKPAEPPQDLLTRWGSTVRRQFELDNVHLLGQQQGHPQVEQLVKVISNLGQTVSTLAHENQLLRDEVKVLSSKMPEITATLGNVQQLLTADVQATLEKLKGMLASEAAGGDELEVTPVRKAAKTPRRASPSRCRADVEAAATAAQEEEQAAAATATSRPTASAAASAGAASSSPASSSPAATSGPAASRSTATSSTSTAAATSAFGGLSQSKAVPPGPVESLKGKSAAVLFMNFMASGGSFPNLLPADVTRAKMVCEQFKAFATEDELKVLRPPRSEEQEPDVMARHAIVKKLDKFVAVRWGQLLLPCIDTITDPKKKRKLAETNQKRMKKAKLAAGAIEERGKEIKKLNGAVPIFSSQACSVWRAQYEGNPNPVLAVSEGEEGSEDNEDNEDNE